jgi:hypothetical protein
MKGALGLPTNLENYFKINNVLNVKLNETKGRQYFSSL